MSFNSHDCETVSMKEAQEQEKNNPVTQIAAAASIAFVVLAEGGQIDDVTATENVEQFAPWAYPIAYKKGNIRRYGSDLYRCNQDHTSQADWTPAAARPCGRRSATRRRNGRNGPSRSAPMTPITPVRRCPITGSTGRPTSRRTSGNLASTVGRR